MSISAPAHLACTSTKLNRRVVLVTTYAANTGGGGANLRSLLPYMEGVSVQWLYLGASDLSLPSSTWLGPTLQELSWWRDALGAMRMWIFRNHPRLRQYARAVVAEPADIFWIVGHNEGLLLACEVARESGRPMHLSIHDDIPEGVFGRSRRYRWLQGAARRALRQALAAACGVDVASDGLQGYYSERYGRRAEIILPYVPESNLAAEGVYPREDRSDLLCGHIGSIYHVDEFVAFCRVFIGRARREKRRPRLLLIGCDNRTLEALGEFIDHIENHPILDEREAVTLLARCDLVYAMYPFESKNTMFRQTSLPTKLSTYVQSLRPVFAHTPADSTLARTVERFAVGKVCSTQSHSGIEEDLEIVRSRKWEREAFERLREEIYGFHNVRRMEAMLLGSSGVNSKASLVR